METKTESYRGVHIDTIYYVRSPLLDRPRWRLAADETLSLADGVSVVYVARTDVGRAFSTVSRLDALALAQELIDRHYEDMP